MKRLIISFIVLTFAVCIFAQDPVWLWIESAGGADWDYGLGIVTDTDGNAYVTGSFELTADFGAYALTSNGEEDIYVAKMDTEGNWLWAESVGGDLYDFGYYICSDAYNDIYVAGSFTNTVTFGSTTLTSNGDRDIFVAKIDSDGNWLWAKNVGGNSNDYGYYICNDSYDNIYVTGVFKESANFGSHNLTSNGDYNIFVAKMDLDGNWLWARGVGEDTDDFSNSICSDVNGNVYVTGVFEGSTNFGSHNVSSNGDYDIFIAKIDTDGNWLWAENAGGSGYDSGNSICSGVDGNIYLTGQITGSANFGTFNLTSNGGYDIFVTKMDTDGNWLWAESTGATDHDFGNSICTDSSGNVFLTGGFGETVNFGSTTLVAHGGRDLFVSQIDPSTGNWLWAVEAGSVSNDKGYSIDTDIDDNIFVTGHFVGTVHIGSFNVTSNGEYDVFVAKFSGTSSADNNIIPNDSEISNYPNPFNPETTINYSLKEDSNVSLNIYNIKGQKVKQLISEQLSAGQHSVMWNGRDINGKQVGSGIYFYKFKTRNYEKTKRMVLLK